MERILLKLEDFLALGCRGILFVVWVEVATRTSFFSFFFRKKKRAEETSSGAPIKKVASVGSHDVGDWEGNLEERPGVE